MSDNHLIDEYYGTLTFKARPRTQLVDTGRQSHLTDFFRAEQQDVIEQSMSSEKHKKAGEEASLMSDLEAEIFDDLAALKSAPKRGRSQGEEEEEEEVEEKIIETPPHDGGEGEEGKNPKKRRRLIKKKEKAKSERSESSSSSEDKMDLGDEEKSKLATASPSPKAPGESLPLPAAPRGDDIDLTHYFAALEDPEEKEKRTKAALAALFNDEEDQMDLDSTTLALKGKGAAAPEKRLLIMPEDREAYEKSKEKRLLSERSDSPYELTFYDSFPLLKGTMDVATVRCVFASNPADSHWSPLEVTTTTTSSVAGFESHLRSLTWGVFTLFGTANGSSSSSGRRRKLTFQPSPSEMMAELIASEERQKKKDEEEEEGSANKAPTTKDYSQMKMDTIPWFILVGNEELMRIAASPFFSYRLCAILLSDDHVKCSVRNEVPVYYALRVDEKVPLWPSDVGTATTNQLIHLVVDTLYAHVELACHRPKGTSGASSDERRLDVVVTQVLKTIDDFPINLNKPAESMLANNLVPLNNYSTRKERQEHLKRSLFAGAQKAEFTTDQARHPKTFNTSLMVRQSSVWTSTRMAYLLTDLEKPCDCWKQQSVATNLPLEIFSLVTHWQRHGPDMVAIEFATLDRFNKQILEYKESAGLISFDVFSLRAVVRLVEFSPEWFAGWYQNTVGAQKPDRDQKLRLYAFFCAASLWRSACSDLERYGPSATYLFTKARRTLLFESNLHDEDTSYAQYKALDHVSDSSERTMRRRSDDSCGPLSEEEVEQVMGWILDEIRDFNKKAPSDKQFEVVIDGYRSRTASLVSKLRITTSRIMIKSILAAAMLFRNVGQNLESPALRRIPPLVVQSSLVYGHKSGQTSEQFYQELGHALGAKINVVILRPQEDEAGAIAALRAIKVSHKLPHVVIFDAFHLWSLKMIYTTFEKLEQLQLLSTCTHFIFTALAHTLDMATGGGALIWELLDVVKDLDKLMGFAPSSSSDGDIFSQILTPAVAKEQSRWVIGYGGDRSQMISEQHYPYTARAEQIKANAELFSLIPKEASKSADQEEGDLCRLIIQRLTSNVDRKIFILCARHVTRRRLEQRIKCINTAFTMEKNPRLRFTMYFDIQATPLQLQGVDTIVLADVEYRGPARPTHLHLNACIEHAQHAVFVLRESADKTGMDVFQDVFHCNDERTDRYILGLARCPLLKTTYDQWVSKEACRKLLRPTASFSRDAH